MATVADNRKRSRDEECCDFMPLSKRINNLHIDNPAAAAAGSANIIIDSNCINQQQFIHSQQFQSQSAHQQDQSHHQQINPIPVTSDAEYCPQQQYQQYLPSNDNSINCSNSCSINNSSDIGHVAMNSGYNPELNQTENPYYYFKNKLLYEMNIERMRRAQ